MNDLQQAEKERKKEIAELEILIESNLYVEGNYYNNVARLPENIRNDFRKHPNEIVFLNQLLIAVAIMVFDYPSRLDKFDI